MEALLEKYDFDSFLTLKSRPLYTYLVSHEERYELIYEDGSLAYFHVCGQ